MKTRILALLLALSIPFSLSGCGSSVGSESAVTKDDASSREDEIIMSKEDETIASMEDAMLQDVKAACTSAGINVSDYSFTENRWGTKIGSDNGTCITMTLTISTDTDMSSMSYQDIFSIFFKNDGEDEVDRSGAVPIAYETAFDSIVSPNATYSASCWSLEEYLEKNELYICTEDGSTKCVGFYDLFNHESAYYTKGVKYWIESEYKRYDKQEGGYSGDKYTNAIFAEASEKFGLSVEYIKLHVW